MINVRHLLLHVVMWASLIPVQAGNRTAIYEAYVSADMLKWKQLIDRMEKEPGKTDAILLELVNYQYGYIGWCLGEDRNEEAEKYLGLAEKHIAVLASKSYKPSYVNAYKAAFYGFRISLSPIKAPVLGPKSLRCAELAMQQDKTNPFGFLQFGNALYFRPKLMGGSKVKALVYLLKAEKLMEASKNTLSDDWNYLSLMALISLGYQQTDRPELAEKHYEKLLKTEPRVAWVKDELYPSLQKMDL